MDKYIDGQDCENFAPIDINVKKFIENGEFKMGRAYIKGLVCLLINNQPNSLYNNSLITFDSSWPTKSQSNNYHHFFPKKSKCIKSSGFSEDEVNNICNIVLCDAVTNQKIIKDANPSVYIPKLKECNDKLGETLKKHFIEDIQDFGIMSNDFKTFREKRAKVLLSALKEKIMLTSKDNIVVEVEDKNIE